MRRGGEGERERGSGGKWSLTMMMVLKAEEIPVLVL